MAIAAIASDREPMREINTTPLIDVMLVLLIMIILTIPVASHSLDYDLPQGVTPPEGMIHPVKNSLVLTNEGRLVWNGRPITHSGLAGLLVEVGRADPEPVVQFEPEPAASYDRSAQVLRIVKGAHLSRFGFSGNEKYRVFGRGGEPSGS